VRLRYRLSGGVPALRFRIDLVGVRELAGRQNVIAIACGHACRGQGLPKNTRAALDYPCTGRNEAAGAGAWRAA